MRATVNAGGLNGVGSLALREEKEVHEIQNPDIFDSGESGEASRPNINNSCARKASPGMTTVLEALESSVVCQGNDIEQSDILWGGDT